MNTTTTHRAGPSARLSETFTNHIAEELRRYIEAGLMMKEHALARLHEPEVKFQRYRPPDSLIDFLKHCDYVEAEIRACR